MRRSLQSIFDKAVSGVIAQGKPSGGQHGPCMYRENGNASDPVRCAVGHLIPDSKYSPRFDNGETDTYVVCNTIGLGKYSDELRRLQSAHDDVSRLRGAEFVAAFKVRARALYEQFNLNTKVLDNA